MTHAGRQNGEATRPEHGEDRGLLSGGNHHDDEDDLGVLHSSDSDDIDDKKRESPTPRSANRVHFNLTPEVHSASARGSGEDRSSTDSAQHFDIEEGDPMGNGRFNDSHHRIPLLSDMEAPSVTLANDLDDEDSDAHNHVERELNRPKSGLKSAFMNMANSIIGAGIIGQPYAMRQAGLLSGTLLLVGLTILIDWTICLIVINSKLSGTSNFQATVEYCYGKPGLIAISVAQWVFAFGGMVAFGVIVGDTIPHVLLAVFPGLPDIPVIGLMTDRRVAISVFCMGVSYPLTLYRDISKLAKASTFALVGMVIIVVTVLVEGIMVPRDQRGSFDLPTLTINDGIFQAIGVISFAFVCHHNSLLIYGSLKKPTIDNFSRVTHYSVGASTVACLVMALAGFLTFGDKTLGNILNNFPSDNVMVNIARLCFGLNMLTTLPLEAFVCREVMELYFWPNDEFNLRRHVLISTGLVGGATVLSLLTCDLGAVFELVGATSAVAMAYVMPPLCYIKLTTRSWRTYMAIAVVIFGAAVMGISLVQAINKMINGHEEGAKCS